MGRLDEILRAAPVSPAGPSTTPTSWGGQEMARPTSTTPTRPASLTAEIRPISAGDIVIAELDGRRHLCAVQRVSRSGVAIVRRLDQLDRYHRLPVTELATAVTLDALASTWLR